MVKVEHSIVIKRPAEVVFGYLTEIANLTEWQSGVLEARSDGPLRVGSTLTELRKFLGMRGESTLEVTELRPNELFSLAVVSGPLPLEVSHRLTPTDEGTRLDVVVQGEPRGFARLEGPLLVRVVRREIDFDLGTLKDLLEARN
jgi:carbon monoxide dehydrogenase subunit G